MQRSPFMDDVILTVGDWTFALWREVRHDQPLLLFPAAPALYTSGCWSPTRAGAHRLTSMSGTTSHMHWQHTLSDRGVLGQGATPAWCCAFLSRLDQGWPQPQPCLNARAALLSKGVASGRRYPVQCPSTCGHRTCRQVHKWLCVQVCCSCRAWMACWRCGTCWTAPTSRWPRCRCALWPPPGCPSVPPAQLLLAGPWPMRDLRPSFSLQVA